VKWRSTALRLFLGAYLATASAPVSAEDEPVSREVLLAEGRYAEAYETALRGNGSDEIAKVSGAALSLLGVSMESQDSYVRWYALRAAQPLSEPALAEHAKRAFRTGDRYDHSLALEVLVHVDAAGGRDVFLEALASPHRSVRLRALKGLTKLRDPSLADRFTEILSKDLDPDLRAFAVQALAQSGSPQAPAALYGGLDDPIPAVREEAVRALVSLRTPGLSAILRQRLAAAPSEERVRALRLVGLSADRELLRDLGPYLADADPEVRAYAAGAILAIDERAGKP
jgi:HEAT repeat protein